MCLFCRSKKDTWWTCKDFHGLALAFSRFPFIILCLTLLLSFLVSWVGISSHGFPDFDNPYLGFKTKRTSISNRIEALENLRSEYRSLQIIENFPGERMSSVEYRRKRQNKKSRSYCSEAPNEGNSRIAIQIDPSSDLLSPEVIGRMCYFQTLLESTFEYSVLCEKDGHRSCCPAWSLPNYVALYSNKKSCSDLKDEDIHMFRKDVYCCLDILRSIYNMSNTSANETRKIAEECQHSHPHAGSSVIPSYCQEEGIIMRSLRYSVETSFSELKAKDKINKKSAINSTAKTSEYAMIILPIPKNPTNLELMDDFTHFVMSIQLPDNIVGLGGFNFGTKDRVFEQLLISDLRYVMVASVIIFVLICLYIKSVFITFISFGALMLSLGVSYFLYNDVFGIPYFPFMNMLVTIIVLGIGTDGTLILSVAWRRCRNNLKDEPFNKQLKLTLMKELLNETSSTLVITTCTTACAFYASLTSSIITIRCFSIFAGTSIIVSFIIIYFSVPTALLASDILCFHIHSLFQNQEENTLISKLLSVGKKADSCKTTLKNFFCNWKISGIINKLAASKLAIGSMIIFCGILVWGCVTVLYYPGFELPETEQFQLLTYNHPIEKYDREIESRFNPEDSQGTKVDDLTFYFVWGVQAVDNGALLDPKDDGFLEFDQNFNLSLKESQVWMHSFCKSVKNQTFYDLESNIATGANFDSCMLETMMKWMDRECKPNISFVKSYEPCCQVSTFPYEPKVFSQCIPLANRDIYRTPAIFFYPDIAGPKFHTTFANPKANEEEVKVVEAIEAKSLGKKKPIYAKMGDLATFTVRVRTNLPYSISYSKMAQYYKTMNDFFDNSIQSAPTNLKNGFVISALFDFFDLQNSLLNDTWYSLFLSTGLCFLFIWASSRSFLVSVGAVVSILAIVVVSSAILIQVFSWKLGVFESIAVTVAVGLSDFTTHHSIEFAKRQSISMMTSATFYSALATIIMGLSMFLFSQVLVYQQIGAFFFVLVLTSWLYSVFFLSPLLLTLNMLWEYFFKWCSQTFGSVLCQELFRCHKLSSDACERRASTLAATSQACDICSKEPCDCSADELENFQGDLDNLPPKKQNLMIEKLKLLKRIAQETTV